MSGHMVGFRMAFLGGLCAFARDSLSAVSGCGSIALRACAVLAAAAAASAEAPAPATSAESLIARLSHEEWAERDAALKALVAMGASAVPALSGFIAGSADPDASLRARDALRQIGWPALVHLLNRDDASPRLAGVREDFIRAFLERAIGKRALEDFDWVPGEPLAADAGRLAGIWESGAMDLRLYRFRWERDALRLDRVNFDGSPYQPPIPNPAKVETAVLPVAEARAMLTLALRACAVRLVEKPDPREGQPGFLRGRTSWLESGGFHARVRITEGARLVFEESYTGNARSDRQKDFVRVDAAGVVFSTAMRTVAWQERPAGEDDQESLLERTGRFGQDEWLVREQLLRILGALGDRRFEPFLRKVIETPLDEQRRQHRMAIDAYARITGTDLRTAPAEDMDVAAVREAYLKRFSITAPGDR